MATRSLRVWLNLFQSDGQKMLRFYVYTGSDHIVIICLQFHEPVILSVDMGTPRIPGKHKRKVTKTTVLFNSLPITGHLNCLYGSYHTNLILILLLSVLSFEFFRCCVDVLQS